LVGDEEVDLVGERRGVRGGCAEQADEGAIVAGAGAVVEVLVRRVGERGEGGIGGLEADEGAVPDLSLFVTPDLIRGPAGWLPCRWRTGLRITSGVQAWRKQRLAARGATG
jgi:hypothetical protein